MKITEQQIQEEIADLISEADRKLASVKAILLDSAGLRKQAELLRNLLELRWQAERHSELMSFIMIGFVRGQKDEPSEFCALTWSGSTIAPSDTRILLKRDWKQLLPAEVATYFKDLLDDWIQMVQTQPEIVLAMIAELSVGPFAPWIKARCIKIGSQSFFRSAWERFSVFQASRSSVFLPAL